MKRKIWNFWAKRYDRLWVQKYSLTPTRNIILRMIKEEINKESNQDKNFKIIDIGCGPGELINVLENTYENFHISGIDFSDEMLKISSARNPRTHHINLDVKDLDRIEGKYNIAISTHSIPYYKDLPKFIGDLANLLEDGGRVYMAFASGESLYDKLALSFVKFTTGPANYPSDEKVRSLVSESFKVESLDIIREKFFMPRIAVYKLKKVKV